MARRLAQKTRVWSLYVSPSVAQGETVFLWQKEAPGLLKLALVLNRATSLLIQTLEEEEK